MKLNAKVFCSKCQLATFEIYADTEGGIDIRCTACGNSLGVSKAYYISDPDEETMPDDDTATE